MNIKFVGSYIVGGNLKDENGCSDTETEAIKCFVDGFTKLCKEAEMKYLFVRRAPVLEQYKDFSSDKIGYRMIGRFSVGDIGEENK